MKSIFSPISKQIELPLQLVTYQKQFTFIDLFAGIGGFRIALDKLGGKCLGYSEIDKQAIKVYQQNFISYLNDDELNDFFIFSDLRNGHTTIHSWDIINTSDREKMICLTLLKYRRSKKYGDKDGNPLSFENFREIITDIKISELNKLLEKGIFRLTADDKYEFVNSKNMTGINNIYRIILPTAEIFPTLTATGSKDYIATVSIHASHPQEYKNLFLEKIYQPHKYIPITAKHACKLQGFPTDFEYHTKDEVAKKQFGNAVPVPVVEYVAKELLRILDI
ncbi:MAG: DNA cytosine methyltransferase [Dolichospermum sp.]